MKKLISILLILSMAVVLVACGNNSAGKAYSPDTEANDQLADNQTDEVTDLEAEAAEDADKPEESKPTDKPAEKPSEKPAESKPSAKPEEKPEESKPAEAPDEKAPTTMGTKLLADFKAIASGKSTEEIANALLSNPVIQFKGVTAPVEEGLLQGFSNTEITGFKSATMFAPIIGSIPFVGYIFELEAGADTSAFISKLRSGANLAWNVCVEADEMITGSVGNKVFFVMCPMAS